MPFQPNAPSKRCLRGLGCKGFLYWGVRASYTGVYEPLILECTSLSYWGTRSSWSGVRGGEDHATSRPPSFLTSRSVISHRGTETQRAQRKGNVRVDHGAALRTVCRNKGQFYQNRPFRTVILRCGTDGLGVAEWGVPNHNITMRNRWIRGGGMGVPNRNITGAD